MTWAKSENTSEIGNRPFAVLSDNLSSPCRYHLSEACRYLHRCCFAEHLNIGDAIVCSTQHCTATRALYKYTEYEKTRRPPITNGKNLFNPFADMFTSNMTTKSVILSCKHTIPTLVETSCGLQKRTSERSCTFSV